MAIQGGVKNLNEDIIRSVQYQISVSGASALTDLQNRMAQVAKEQALATAMHNAAALSDRQYADVLASLSKEERELAASIKLATAAMAQGGVVTDQLVESLKKSEGVAQRTSYAFFQVAYAIDDMQYGLPALTNNVVGLTTGLFGNSAAVSGVATAIVAAMAVYKNWNTIVDAGYKILYYGIPLHEEERKELERLEKQTDRNADAQARYNQLKERASNIDKTMAIKGNVRELQTKAIEEAIGEAGGAGDVAGNLAAILEKGGQTQNPAQEEKIKDLYEKWVTAKSDFDKTGMPQEKIARGLAADALQKARDDYAKERSNKARELATKVVGLAPHEDDKLRELMGHVRARPEAFPQGLLAGLEKGTKPEVIKARTAEKSKKVLEEGRQHAEMLDKMFEEEYKLIKHTSEELAKHIFPSVKAEAFKLNRIPTARDVLSKAAEVKGGPLTVAEQKEVFQKWKTEWMAMIDKQLGDMPRGSNRGQAFQALKEEQRKKDEQKADMEARRAGAAQKRIEAPEHAASLQVAHAMTTEMKEPIQLAMRQRVPRAVIKANVAMAMKDRIPDNLIDEAAEMVVQAHGLKHEAQGAARDLRMGGMQPVAVAPGMAGGAVQAAMQNLREKQEAYRNIPRRIKNKKLAAQREVEAAQAQIGRAENTDFLTNALDEEVGPAPPPAGDAQAMRGGGGGRDGGVGAEILGEMRKQTVALESISNGKSLNVKAMV